MESPAVDASEPNRFGAESVWWPLFRRRQRRDRLFSNLFLPTFTLSLLTFVSAFSIALVPAFLLLRRRYGSKGARSALIAALSTSAGMVATYVFIALPATALWGGIPFHNVYAFAVAIALVIGAVLVVAGRPRRLFSWLTQHSGNRTFFALGLTYGLAALAATHYCPETVVAAYRAGFPVHALVVLVAYVGGKGLLLAVAVGVSNLRIPARWAIQPRWAAAVPMGAMGLYALWALASGVSVVSLLPT